MGMMNMKIEITYFKEAEFSIDKLFSFFLNNKSTIIFLHKNISESCNKSVAFEDKNATGIYQNFIFKNERSFVLSSNKADWYLLETYKSNGNLFNYVDTATDVYFLKLKK